MTRPAHARNAEIIALHDAGYTDVEIAATVGEITPGRVGAIVRRATDTTRKPGRRPTAAITPTTARGRALLAQLLAVAAEALEEPEAWIEARR